MAFLFFSFLFSFSTIAVANVERKGGGFLSGLPKVPWYYGLQM